MGAFLAARERANCWGAWRWRVDVPAAAAVALGWSAARSAGDEFALGDLGQRDDDRAVAPAAPSWMCAAVAPCRERSACGYRAIRPDVDHRRAVRLRRDRRDFVAAGLTCCPVASIASAHARAEGARRHHPAATGARVIVSCHLPCWWRMPAGGGHAPTMAPVRRDLLPSRIVSATDGSVDVADAKRRPRR
jgi:hypothetical protein